jgi:hypothetical protein
VRDATVQKPRGGSDPLAPQIRKDKPSLTVTKGLRCVKPRFDTPAIRWQGSSWLRHGHLDCSALNAVTKQLQLLERAGLIEREKRGREVLISLRPEPLRLVSGWVHEYERFWNDKLDAFEGHFKRKRGKQS